MADGDYQITICHGATKHEVVVWGSMLLGDLSQKIEALLHVLPSNQKIIYKGRNLTALDVPLDAYGIRPGAKIMVLGRKFDPEDDEKYQAIIQIEKSCTKVERKLCEIIPQVDGIANGYVECGLCGEALAKLQKQQLAVNEEFMRLLEQLDGFTFEDNQAPARQKRKSVVKRIQQLMEKSDQVQETINHLIKSYS